VIHGDSVENQMNQRGADDAAEEAKPNAKLGQDI
jgi:hypothetical protein